MTRSGAGSQLQLASSFPKQPHVTEGECQREMRDEPTNPVHSTRHMTHDTQHTTPSHDGRQGLRASEVQSTAGWDGLAARPEAAVGGSGVRLAVGGVRLAGQARGMLRYAALCCAVLRYAALCCAMLRYAALCCAMLRYAALCCACAPHKMLDKIA